MILNVRVIPKASRSLIKKENDYLKVYVTKPAADGLANAQLIDLLAGYLKVKKYRIKIIRGEKSRNKLCRIENNEG